MLLFALGFAKQGGQWFIFQLVSLPFFILVLVLGFWRCLFVFWSLACAEQSTAERDGTGEYWRSIWARSDEHFFRTRLDEQHSTSLGWAYELRIYEVDAIDNHSFSQAHSSHGSLHLRHRYFTANGCQNVYVIDDKHGPLLVASTSQRQSC